MLATGHWPLSTLWPLTTDHWSPTNHFIFFSSSETDEIIIILVFVLSSILGHDYSLAMLLKPKFRPWVEISQPFKKSCIDIYSAVFTTSVIISMNILLVCCCCCWSYWHAHVFWFITVMRDCHAMRQKHITEWCTVYNLHGRHSWEIRRMKKATEKWERKKKQTKLKKRFK